MIKQVRLEICGGIASGKTTLASLLESMSACVQYERFQDNPFFSEFYQDPSGYSFETEITYLLQHFSQIRQCGSVTFGVCDFSLALDLAYAHVTLTDSADRQLFEQVLKRVLEKISLPSLIVRLYCPASLELRRIRIRQRSVESAITDDFLSALDQSVEYALKSRWFSSVPVLSIDSGKLDFREGGADRERVRVDIEAALRGLQ